MGLMKRLPLTATDEDLLAAVNEWVGLLAEGRYADAYQWLHHPEPPRWPSPEVMATVIRNYGFIEPRPDGRTFTVTPIGTATGDRYDAEVTRYDSGTRGDVHFDLPLNGWWSDVTAILDFSVHEGTFVFELDDIHVL
jgi:hypothetical protein